MSHILYYKDIKKRKDRENHVKTLKTALGWLVVALGGIAGAGVVWFYFVLIGILNETGL